MINKIDRFVGKYAFLSNFYPSPISYGGISYPTVEHAYQAQKTQDQKLRTQISMLDTPGNAKRMGRVLPLRPDWSDEFKLGIMYWLVKEKFEDSDLEKLLLETGDAELVEGNNWNDTYWGVRSYDGEGENHLGKILMRVRQELKEAL